MSWAREHLFLEYAEFDGERKRESARVIGNCIIKSRIFYVCIVLTFDIPIFSVIMIADSFGEYLDYNDVAVVFVFLLSLVTMTMATTMMLIAIDMTNEGDKNLIHINRCVQYVTH